MLIDKLKGLPYGGAALVFKPQPKPTPKKYNTTVGFVAAVQDDITSQNGTLEMHKDSWIGAINLPEEYVKQLRQLFKCVQCRSNEHTLTSCPLMKNWIIRKKVPRTEQPMTLRLNHVPWAASIQLWLLKLHPWTFLTNKNPLPWQALPRSLKKMYPRMMIIGVLLNLTYSRTQIV
jgi:hypothetical protein